MKEAMWGVGLIIIALITFVVISTVSNVVTTNQQDYEFMKSSVEAAMHDAVDETRYRRGMLLMVLSHSIVNQIMNYLTLMIRVNVMA